MAIMDDEARQIIRRKWFHALGEIADLDLQRRTWLDLTNTDNPHWYYIEFVCSYPSNEELADGVKKGYLLPQEAEILIAFRQILVAHTSPTGDAWDNEAVLNDPAWHTVVKAAQTAFKELAALPRP